MFNNLIVELSDDPSIARDLDAVVKSTVKEFTKICTTSSPAGIRPLFIKYRQEGPLVDSTTDTNVYTIYLSENARDYTRLVYQLGHELCHIFADPRRSNWFVESICELASQMLLCRMSETWIDDPPYSHWSEYAPNFKKYLEYWIQEVSKDLFKTDTLPNEDKLHQWLASVYASLKDDPCDRPRNAVIAIMVRPFFEESVDNWSAVSFLGEASVFPPVNLKDLNLNSDFEYDKWEEAVPKHLRELVRRIKRLFIKNTV